MMINHNSIVISLFKKIIMQEKSNSSQVGRVVGRRVGKVYSAAALFHPHISVIAGVRERRKFNLLMPKPKRECYRSLCMKAGHLNSPDFPHLFCRLGELLL